MYSNEENGIYVTNYSRLAQHASLNQGLKQCYVMLHACMDLHSKGKKNINMLSVANCLWVVRKQ